jgi:N4-gp56 family major capsid protein
MAQATSTSLADDMALYIRDELLDIAERNVVFAQHALMAPLPQHNGKTCQFSRYPRLALPFEPAIEGETPDSVAVSVETVQAITDQWILVVEHTDLAEITVKHPLVATTTELLGLAQAELVDREIQTVLLADSDVVFANAVAGSNTVRSNLATTDVVNSTEMRKLWAILSRNGARRIGTNYVFICDPEVSQDIHSQQDFVGVHEFTAAKAMFNNVIGSWLGFDVEVSNNIPTISLGASGDWTVAAGAVTGETFANGETVFVRLEAINATSGQVEKSYAAKSTTVATTEGVLVTVPSTAGFLYNVYVSNTNNTSTLANFQLVSAGNAPSTIVSILDFPTSDDAAQRPQQEPASGVTVHTSYAIGKEAYGMVKLSGDNLRVMMTDQRPTDSDPAAQRRKISLKGSFKAVVLNSDWVQRIESGSAF